MVKLPEEMFQRDWAPLPVLETVVVVMDQEGAPMITELVLVKVKPVLVVAKALVEVTFAVTIGPEKLKVELPTLIRSSEFRVKVVIDDGQFQVTLLKFKA